MGGWGGWGELCELLWGRVPRATLEAAVPRLNTERLEPRDEPRARGRDSARLLVLVQGDVATLVEGVSFGEIGS